MFVDNQPVAELPQLGIVQFSLSPGSHEVYVGFENHKSLWKKAQRSACMSVNLEPGHTYAYSLKFNSQLVLLFELSIFGFLGLFTTQGIWLYPMLNQITSAFWDACPMLVEVIQFGLTYHIFALIVELALIFCFFHLCNNKHKLLLLTEDGPLPGNCAKDNGKIESGS